MSSTPKAGPAPAFLLPSAANTAALQPQPQQTVDGALAALEIGHRSSYVPAAPHWRSIPGFRKTRPLNATRLELPLWMKF
jgi:hypothetical protein